MSMRNFNWKQYVSAFMVFVFILIWANDEVQETKQFAIDKAVMKERAEHIESEHHQHFISAETFFKETREFQALLREAICGQNPDIDCIDTD